MVNNDFEKNMRDLRTFIRVRDACKRRRQLLFSDAADDLHGNELGASSESG